MTTRLPRSSLARNGAYVVVFNALIAAGLTAVGYGGPFWAVFVHSQSIGVIAWLVCDGGRRVLWPRREPTLGPLLALMGFGALAGWAAGTWIPARLFGIPWSLQNYSSSLIISALAVFIAARFFRERERLLRTERLIAEAQLKLLQAQIEPHFLFNTLANLRALIATDPARAQLMLDHLDAFLRAALTAARKERSTLGDEFRLLRDYLEILAIRMGPRLRYRLDLPEALASAQLPPMLVQPLVENAVRHGIEPALAGGEIAVSASTREGRLVIEVTDTGAGGSAAATAGARVGLAQIRERLRGVYGGGASFQLTEQPNGGVIATLDLPAAGAHA